MLEENDEKITRNQIQKLFDNNPKFEREPLLYDLIRKGYTIQGLNDNQYLEPSQNEKYILSLPNYTVLEYYTLKEYGLFSKIIYTGIGFLIGILIIFVLYKVFRYIFYGDKILSFRK